jgi:hypothetical protein
LRLAGDFAQAFGQLAFLLCPIFRRDGDRFAGIKAIEQHGVDAFLGLAFLVSTGNEKGTLCAVERLGSSAGVIPVRQLDRFSR